MESQVKIGSASCQISGFDMRRKLRTCLLLTVAATCLPHAVYADLTLPQDASVVSGGVNITITDNSKMTLSQSQDRAVVNWGSFSVGREAHVDIQQPTASSAILNRVTGDTTSEIHGRITANGQIYLVNPNGIFIGPDGAVDASAFVASSLNIEDADFQQEALKFRGLGASAKVENAGRVTITPGGYAAFLGGQVRNSGTVTVPRGRVGFGAGERVTLDLSGDGFLEVALPSDLEDESALIDNSGVVSSDGGLIEMRAATAREAVRNAVNLSGIAEARSVSMQGGTIILGGGDGGRVTVSGKVSTQASRARIEVLESKRPRMRGGQVDITGSEIVLDGVSINASGDAGGGLIRIGGDFFGQGQLQSAQTLMVDAKTHISVDALEDGDGGRVVLWSDLLTDFAGEISARGGPSSGNGGFVEVSSKQVLRYSGIADRRAPNGVWGTLLLDPENITINSGEGGEDGLEGNLELGDVILDTTSDFNESGNITINTNINWSAATELAFVADNDILINGSLSGPNGSVVMDAMGDILLYAPITTNTLSFSAGSIIPDANSTINVSNFSISDGDWIQINDPLPTFVVTSEFDAVSFNSFVRARSGNGELANPYILSDIYGVQGMTSPGQTDKHYALSNDIDAGVTEGWNYGSREGFLPIWPFAGSLEGNGYTISNLYSLPFNGEGVDQGGMFDTIWWTGTVRNLRLSNASIFGSSAGILAGSNFGLIENVWVDGEVRGQAGGVGGLVGSNGGVINDSVANVFVEADDSPNDSVANVFVEADDSPIVEGDFGLGGGGSVAVGGFVGDNFGTINRSHALGDVSVSNVFGTSIRAGGFVGWESSFLEEAPATINDSYALGSVDVESNVGDAVDVRAGGFVGDLQGPVNRSFSTGTVTVLGDATVERGGFAGADQTGGEEGNSSFWDRDTSGLETSAAGSSLSTQEFQNTETFISIGEEASWDFNSVWAPGDTGFYPVNYSTSPVILATPNPITVQYGLTDVTPTTGSIVGGPSLFVFDDEDDTLNSAPVFQPPFNYSSRNVGARTFTLPTTELLSANGVSYRVIDRPGSASIFAASLTVRADDQTKTYGTGLNPLGSEFTITAGTLFFEDALESVTLSSAGFASDASVSESPYEIGASNAIGSGLSNYAIEYVSGDLTVDPASLTVRADDQTKTYGTGLNPLGSEFTITAGTLFFEDALESVTLSSAGFASDASISESPYEIGASNAIGSGLSNYAIEYVSGDLTVDPASLTVRADDQTKTYGTGLNPLGSEFTITAGTLFFEDALESVTLSSAGFASDASISESPYEIGASNAIGSGLSNYAIEYVSGDLTVDPASLTVRADDQTKTYGTGLNPLGSEFTITAGTLFFEDALESVTLSSAGFASDASVSESPYEIGASNAIGSGLSNYAIEYVSGDLTVGPASLTVRADDQTKTYGTGLNPLGSEFTITAGTLFFEDALESVTLSSAGFASDASVSESPYEIGASNAIGSGLSNYAIEYVSGDLTVDPASLTVRADDQTKTYGTGLNPLGSEFTITAGTLFFEDALESVTLSSAGFASDASVSGSPYEIAASGAVGSGLSNYAIEYVSGDLTVDPASLTVRADDQTKTYGTGLNPLGSEFTITAGTLFFEDALESVTLSSAGFASDASVSGSPYEIAASGAVGSGLSNYAIEYVSGDLTVDPASLTVRADDQTKLEGEEFSFTGTEFSVEGLLFDSTVRSVSLSSQGAERDGAALESPFVISIGQPVGNGLENYDITFVPGTLFVDPVAVSLAPPLDFNNEPLVNPRDEVKTGLGDRDNTSQLDTRDPVELANEKQTLAAVGNLVSDLLDAINACDQQSGDVNRYLACLSDALNAFAGELDAIATDLPPGMQNVAQIVQDARVQIDTARQRAQMRLATATSDAEHDTIRIDAVNEARAALTNASNEIRKAIALVRVEDPELALIQRATINQTASALDTVGISLARATGL